MAECFLVTVTGGAGYVSSHMVDLLVDQGAAVTVVDNLQQGNRAALRQGVDLFVADVADFDAMDQVLAGRDWHAIIHFAALSLVGESMQCSMHYLRENASGGFTLIDAALRNSVPRFILSSAANLFGEPDAVPSPKPPRCAPTPPTARAN